MHSGIMLDLVADSALHNRTATTVNQLVRKLMMLESLPGKAREEFSVT